MAKGNIGLIGLAVMGQNLVLNMESKGFAVSVFNRTAARTEGFMKGEAAGKNIIPSYSIEEFVNSLETPRKIMLMVKAGQPVDDFIGLLRPHLSEGDLLIDGGNSFYKDTERRAADLEADGILYIGTGVSGGEEGARKGPCIIPGGQRKAYALVEDILTKIAAQTEDGPCCTYIGPRGAGHYVKMVHNGIEYGMMQAIAETYDIMRNGAGMAIEDVQKAFAEWNAAEMGGYLMEITADILTRKDDDTGKPIVDIILDKAGQKGTGKWTSQDAFDVGIPVPTITAAVEARIISAFKEQRVEAAKVLCGPDRGGADADELVKNLRSALYATIVACYAQGMTLLSEVSKEHDYGLDLAEISRIWKGGCIIRSKLLDIIKEAYKKRPDLPNLFMDGKIGRLVMDAQAGWRGALQMAIGLGIPTFALGTALAYYDSYRSARLPASITQAQRDYFGAHTYERVDKEGSFHTQWL